MKVKLNLIIETSYTMDFDFQNETTVKDIKNKVKTEASRLKLMIKKGETAPVNVLANYKIDSYIFLPGLEDK